MAFLPALFLLAAMATATATSTAECCDLLSQTFPSQLVLPDSNSYNASTSSYFFMQQRVLAPNCIVQPKSEEDVSKVVKTIQSCTDVEVAIRSGGHSPNVGFSNANAGVTIDLRGLNKIELSADGNTVELGTGNEWVDVYQKLDPLGKSVVGARVADVGVGGFLSGGESKTGPFLPDPYEETKLIIMNQVGYLSSPRATASAATPSNPCASSSRQAPSLPPALNRTRPSSKRSKVARITSPS